MAQVSDSKEKHEEGSLERRCFKSEVRAMDASADDGGAKEMRITGYAAVFNEYTNMGWYAEVILPGFFDGIKDDRCACLLNHEYSQVLGRKANGTLDLRSDKKGLVYESKLPSSRSDVFELIQEGYVYESSFSFTTAKSVWEEVERSALAGLLSDDDLDQLSYGGKVTVRRLEKGKELFDVSPATFGQYESTSADTRIARRSFELWKGEKPPMNDQPRDYERRKKLLEAKRRSLNTY